MAQAPAAERIPSALDLQRILGVTSGFVLYTITSVAGWIFSLSGFLPVRYASPYLWIALILLANILPTTLFFWCRRERGWLAWSLLVGSFFGCTLHLIYAVFAWQEAIETAPTLGITFGSVFQFLC